MKKLCLFISVILFLNSFCSAEELLAGKIKDEIVIKVASIMEEKYVFADVGKKMGKSIRALNRKGDYKDCKKLKDFLGRLTKDLRSVSNDKHLYVFYSPEEAREVRAYKKLLPASEIKKIEDDFHKMEMRDNFGFKKVEILEGNVGYLDLRYFASPEKTVDITVGVMKFLANTDAIIIDLRRNGGGEGNVLLTSYFFSQEKILLERAFFRDKKLNEESWTLPDVPGKRVPKKDLYILTSSGTFSAAESFAYSLKHLKRATVIGERTKGGAHPVDVLIVKGDILTQVSIGYSKNPITKTNWEGVGVKPHVEVKASEALNTAHKMALEEICKKSKDKHYKKELKAIINNLKKK